MRARRERVVHASLRLTEAFMHACISTTEAAGFRVQKCANNHQLIVAGFERFYDTHAQPVSVSPRHAKRRVRYVYIYTQTLIVVFFVHGNGNMHACITGGYNLFYF